MLFLIRKQRQNKSRLVLAGLSTSLLLTYIFFMIGMEGTPGTPLCTFSAVAVHYTLLSSFCWMLVEAIVIFLGLHKDMFVVARDVRLLPAAVFSWGGENLKLCTFAIYFLLLLICVTWMVQALIVSNTIMIKRSWYWPGILQRFITHADNEVLGANVFKKFNHL